MVLGKDLEQILTDSILAKQASSLQCYSRCVIIGDGCEEPG